MIEITQLAMQESTPALDGAGIDSPRLGDRLTAHFVEIRGWLVGRKHPAIAVELVDGESVIARSEVADNARFTVVAVTAGMTPLTFQVVAVLADQTRVPVAAVRAERHSDAGLSEVGAPLVSVVIPCFDSSRFLAEAIESVLSQTYPHFEIIVVDDGSHDNAGEVVRRYPAVRYVRQPNLGLSSARNAGLHHSRGSYLVFLDADDRLLPDALRIGLDELAAEPAAVFASGGCVHIGFDGTRMPSGSVRVVERDHYGALLRNCYIWAPAAVMFRRIAFSCVGGFDTALRESADHDLYLRLARTHRVRCHGDVVAEYRRHGGNMTRNPRANLRDRIDVLRRQRRTFDGSGREHYEAYRAGLAFARDYFGEPLTAAVVSDVATGEWQSALKGYCTLLAYYPRGAVAALISALRVF